LEESAVFPEGLKRFDKNGGNQTPAPTAVFPAKSSLRAWFEPLALSASALACRYRRHFEIGMAGELLNRLDVDAALPAELQKANPLGIMRITRAPL